MAEVRLILENKQIKYNGLFRLDELYNIVKNYTGQRGYYILEKRNQEDVLESGKRIFVELEILKSMSDYYKAEIRLEIDVKGLKDQVIALDGHKQKFQHGEVSLKFFTYLKSDRRDQWEGSGFAFLMRTIMDKFVRHDLTHKTEEDVKRDTLGLADELRAYLNMSRFKISSTMHPHKE
jgi:hypothetical protein